MLGGSQMTKGQIYERMTVELTEPDPEIPCEFAAGKSCGNFYGSVLLRQLSIMEITTLLKLV